MPSCTQPVTESGSGKMSLSYDRRHRRPRHCTKKARAERAHAKLRAQQRYGLTLSTTQLHRLVDDIHNGMSLKSWRQSCTRSKHVLICQGQQVLVVYDNTRHEIVTFLPLDRPVVLESPDV